MRKRNVDRKAVLQQMMALAAGRANDAVKLAYLPEEALETLSRLDLGCLTEFKRSSNGAVEVKLTDRAAVLVKLYKPRDGRKEFSGTLTGYADGNVTVTVDGRELTFEKSEVALVRLRVEF